MHPDIKDLARAMPQVDFKIPNLPPQIQKALGTNADSLMFSVDSLAKQFRHHSGLTVDKYIDALNHIKDCKEIYQPKDCHASLVVGGKRHYAVILKTTADHLEAYMVSLFPIERRNLNKWRETLKRIL
jgi:pyruvate-formate lyase